MFPPKSGQWPSWALTPSVSNPSAGVPDCYGLSGASQMAGMQLRICELNEWIEEVDAGIEITPVPAFLGWLRRAQSLSTRGL